MTWGAILVCAAVLGACGSSGPPKNKRAGYVAATTPLTTASATVVTDAQPTTTSAQRPRSSKAKTKPAEGAKVRPTRTAAAPSSPSVVVARNPVTTPSAPPPISRAPSPPLKCLQSAALANAREQRSNFWIGDAASGSVFVDGPFPSMAKARAAAASLVTVEKAESGGFYVVSATFPSHLDARVHQVARCLLVRGGGGRKPRTGKLTF